MKAFSKVFLFCVAGFFSSVLAAQTVETRDYRQQSFKQAMKQVESLLTWYKSNASIINYDVRYVVAPAGDAQSCSSNSYQSATISEGYEVVSLVNGMAFGEIRLEVTGNEAGGKTREWLVLLNHPIDSAPVDSVKYFDFSSLDYASARDKVTNNLIGWYETSHDVSSYQVSYTDPTTGASQQFSVSSGAEMSTLLDGLAAGDYRIQLDVVFADGVVSTRFVALNKLAVDVTPNTVDFQLTWSMPSQREDGTVITAQDIAGYEIYLTMIDGNNQPNDQVYSVNSGSQTSLTLQDMATGQYHMAISAIDTNGLKSALSSVVSYTVN